jgi:hypothetical protein
MTRPPQYENGAYGANPADSATGAYDILGAHPEDGGPGGPPNVYVPPAVPPPAYDAYADPATAHGWQNAYDATQELPPVADGEAGPAVGDHDPAVAGGPRHGSGRRSRRKPSPWRSRRVAVAAGAVGAVSVALIAGFSFSGSSSGGTQGKDDRTSPAAGEPATPTATDPASSAGTAATGRPSDSSPSDAPSARRSASTSGSGSGAGKKDPATKSPTPAPTTSTPSGSGPGNSNGKPGHGPGGTKDPK